MPSAKPSRPAANTDASRARGRPAPALAGYSGTPLPKKLGIKPGGTVALVDAPRGFRRTLGALPAGAKLRAGLAAPADLVLWFAPDLRRFEARLPEVLRALGRDGVWIMWPKKASGVATDLTESAVRGGALAVGLVDFKVCAVDATWSGLKFTVRRPA